MKATLQEAARIYRLWLRGASPAILEEIPVHLREVFAMPGALTLNFHIDEFMCHDGTAVPAELRENCAELARNLQVLRNFLSVPIHVNSGYRTVAYNRSIGGAKKSQHLLAKAADIVVRGKTPAQVAAIIERLITGGKMKQGGIGIYKTFCHYDVRGTRSRWNG